MPSKPVTPSTVSDARLREVYAKFVDSKRQCNESTADVTYDALARNLNETANKLLTKHAGRKVDFDVIVRDGKTVIKPVVR